MSADVLRGEYIFQQEEAVVVCYFAQPKSVYFQTIDQ